MLRLDLSRLYFRLLHAAVDSTQMFNINVCRRLDSNCRARGIQATALPTAPQPQPNICHNTKLFENEGFDLPNDSFSESFVFVIIDAQDDKHRKARMDQVRIIDHEVVGVSLKIVTRVQLAECDQGDTGGKEANDQEVDREVGQGVLLHIFQHQILHEL